MDAFEEQSDPAADFLAREQEELGELGEELGLSNQNPEVVVDQMGDLSIEEESRQEVEAINQDMGQQRSGNPSPAFVMPPRPKEEPETIKQWRADQAKRLEEKDAKEAETMKQLRSEAEQELKDW